MNHDSYDNAHVRKILHQVKTVAIVGASANTIRPSYFVVRYLISKGYDVIPVNPGHAGKEIAGAMTYASLSDIERPIDMVEVFRNSEAALEVTKDALKLDPLPKVIWMQLQVRNDEAAKLAEEAGVTVVMNRCPKIEYARLCGEIGWLGITSGVVSSRKPKLAGGYQRFGINNPDQQIKQ